MRSEPTIEEAAEALHREGWSTGDLAITAASAIVWMVFAHREKQRIVTRAPSQSVAWSLAAEAATRLGS